MRARFSPFHTQNSFRTPAGVRFAARPGVQPEQMCTATARQKSKARCHPSVRLRVATSRLRAAWRPRGPKPAPSRRYGQAAPAAAAAPAPRTGRHGELVHQPRRWGHGRGVGALTSADKPPGRRAARHKCNLFALAVATPRAHGDGDIPALRWQQQRVLQVPKPATQLSLCFFSPNLEVTSLAPPSAPLPPPTRAFAAPGESRRSAGNSDKSGGAMTA